jgi:hypothetical protein
MRKENFNNNFLRPNFNGLPNISVQTVQQTVDAI